jgi:ADP-ribose pyrophosphatase YjhB (NUDIX family)
VTREEILGTLRATPDRVEAAARGLSPDQLARRPKEREWSMGEILHHLLVGERDVILPRLQRILRENSPVFRSSAPSRTGFAAAPAPGDFAEDLSAFRRVRGKTLAFLEGLADGDWQRTGTTPTRGTLTIEAYARYLAEHDLEHLAQLGETSRRAVEGRTIVYPTFPVAVHVFLLRGEEVLLLRRANTGYEDGRLSVVAGHVEPGETVTRAATRETREEVGLELSRERLRVVGVMHRKSRDERVDFFLAYPIGSERPENREPEKCSELVWARLSRLPADTVPYVRAAIENFQNRVWFQEFGWDDGGGRRSSDD